MRYLIPLALLLAFAACASAPHLRDENLDIMVRHMIRWLAANSEYSEQSPPRIEFVIRVPGTEFYSQLTAKGYSGLAQYLPGSRTVLLPHSWSGKSASDLGQLAHEITHYLQDISGADMSCLRDTEMDAYELQIRYMKSHFASEIGLPSDVRKFILELPCD